MHGRPANRATNAFHAAFCADSRCDIGDPQLRTLAALHLASALLLGDALTAFVAYDHRLAEAARTAGLVVAAPGSPPPPEQG